MAHPKDKIQWKDFCVISKVKKKLNNCKCYKISYLINWSKHIGAACPRPCVSNVMAPPAPPPTKASEGGVIVHPAITKDPELLMVAAMIDPSWKFTMVENEFQRTVKIAE